MAISKPEKFPRWATDPTSPPPNEAIIEPSEAKKDQGFVAEKPTFANTNWLFNLIHQWEEYLDYFTQIMQSKLKVSEWFQQTNGKAFDLNAVAAGNDGANYYNIVAVGGADGVDAYILTSADRGKNWIERVNPKNFDLRSVAWGKDPSDMIPVQAQVIAVGDADGTDAYIAESTDGGISWDELSNPKNFGLKCVCYGEVDGSFWRFVAVGDADGTDAYLVERGREDGVVGPASWNECTNPKNVGLNGVCYSPSLGLYCAVGNADGTDAYILTSPTGKTGTWTERANPYNIALHSVVWAEELGLFVAVGEGTGLMAYIATSPDGETWTYQINPHDGSLRSVAWDGNILLAVGLSNGVEPYILSSVDGIVWIDRFASNPEDLDLYGVCHERALNDTLALDSSVFVAVGEADITDAYILTSIIV